MIKKKFWKNKKVLITGHTGFKGRWLTILLKNLGANVNGISLKEKKNFRQLEYINFLEKKNSFNIDIRKKNDVNKVIKKIQSLTLYSPFESSFKRMHSGLIETLSCPS